MNAILTLLCLLSIVLSLNALTFSPDEISQVTNGRNFKGRVVLVTGSSSGIGEAIVKLFSLLGAKVVVTGRRAAEVKRVAQEAQQLSPEKLKPLEVVADVAKSDDLERLMDETIKTYGKLDVLVNNAGIYKIAAFSDTKNYMKIYDQTFQVNVRPVLELSQLAVPHLGKTNGSIITTSSRLAEHPMPYGSAYCMSKAALDMMTKALALELGPNIRVNSINPGLTETNLNSDPDVDPALIKALQTTIRNKTPLGRLGSPLDMAKAVVFVASTDGQFINGANINIDGGIKDFGFN
ncbi:unnamed protein product [Medioppia subpectinata]|uniref:Uncharacterized protein n=1 Tax=Medioppia subpectinata TaxID=1979941 RepID=A0A7R9KKF3_9ACAR|nr:unnamed protein product [Medioppia subpectinata]CAG2105370.1 unnamed protein product [Medioppia subpectinata]